jgi:hypothetical protein
MLSRLRDEASTTPFIAMDSHTINHSVRAWKILCWNVRGINSTKKWHAMRSKIVKTHCDIVCLQETKREAFDIAYISVMVCDNDLE